MHVIFCETTGDWSAWLKADLHGEVKLLETRSLEGVWELLDRHGQSIVALEMTAARVEPSLAALWRINRQYPAAVGVVLARRALAALEWEARCAGAALFVDSPRRMHQLSSLVRHNLARTYVPNSCRDDDLPIEERLFAGLPWSG